jgi:hypothetical protein
VDRAEKREFVAELNGVFTNAGSVVVAHYAGLTVAQMNDLRSRMRTAGGTVKVAKNRLAKIALQGTESEGVASLFEGQTLIAYCEDPVTAPKIAVEFTKVSDKLVMLGGAMGATTLDADGCQGACHDAVDRRAARKDCWHDSDASNAHRPDRQRTSRVRWPASSARMPGRTKPHKADLRCE